MLLTLHSLALGAVLSDGKQHSDKAHGYGIQVRAVGEVRDAPGAAYDTAKADLQAGRAAQALDGFRRAVRETPHSADALNGLAVTYDLLGRFDQSRVYYEAALVADPQSALIAYNYGYSLFLQHDFVAARPLLVSALHSDDAAARAAARSTLQQIADAPADAPAPAPIASERRSWVERTSEGEQRLVLDRDVPVTAVATTAISVTTATAEIALIAPATAWSAADERRVDAAARLETLAAARAERIAARAASAAPVPAAAPASAPATLAQVAFDAAASASTDTLPATPRLRPPTLAPLRLPAPVAAVAVAAAAPLRRAAPSSAAFGFHLMSSDLPGEPPRRRTVPVAVGGTALMDMLAASLSSEPIGETASRALGRLIDSLNTIGTAATAEMTQLPEGLDRLAGALGLWSGRA